MNNTHNNNPETQATRQKALKLATQITNNATYDSDRQQNIIYKPLPEYSLLLVVHRFSTNSHKLYSLVNIHTGLIMVDRTIKEAIINTLADIIATSKHFIEQESKDTIPMENTNIQTNKTPLEIATIIVTIMTNRARDTKQFQSVNLDTILFVSVHSDLKTSKIDIDIINDETYILENGTEQQAIEIITSYIEETNQKLQN